MSRRSFLSLANLGAVGVILAIDWIAPPGLPIWILACIPILLSATSDDPRQIRLTGTAAIAGLLLVGVFGPAPTSAAAVWAPDGILILLMLPVAFSLALLLQRRRLEAQRARDQALSASALNRLLVSLLAHDLRSPLALAGQGFDYVEASLSRGTAIETDVIAEIRARIERSLETLEKVLAVARAELSRTHDPADEEARCAVRLRQELEAQIRSFLPEAEAREKDLVGELEELDEAGAYRADVFVLREALSILLDNAIRYAIPGRVQVRAGVRGGVLTVRVEDEGPGLTAHARERNGAGGSGLGLRLCGALLELSGGHLEIERDRPDGTCLALTLPVTPLGRLETKAA